MCPFFTMVIALLSQLTGTAGKAVSSLMQSTTRLDDAMRLTTGGTRRSLVTL